MFTCPSHSPSQRDVSAGVETEALEENCLPAHCPWLALSCPHTCAPWHIPDLRFDLTISYVSDTVKARDLTSVGGGVPLPIVFLGAVI